MLDWLHWGGQLIVSGPDTLNVLRGSFLAPYLPAAEGATRETHDRIARAAERLLDSEEGQSASAAQPVRPWSGIELVKATEAEFVPHTGDLVVERQVGRGRIVATAFRLSLRALQNGPALIRFSMPACCVIRRGSSSSRQQ